MADDEETTFQGNGLLEISKAGDQPGIQPCQGVVHCIFPMRRGWTMQPCNHRCIHAPQVRRHLGDLGNLGAKYTHCNPICTVFVGNLLNSSQPRNSTSFFHISPILPPELHNESSTSIIHFSLAQCALRGHFSITVRAERCRQDHHHHWCSMRLLSDCRSMA